MLSRYQVRIFPRGLDFTPTPTRNNVYLKSGMKIFSRKLKLANVLDNISKIPF